MPTGDILHDPALSARAIRHLKAIEKKEGYSVSEITEEEGFNPGNSSMAFSELEDYGYIEKRENPEDSRETILFLTDKGKVLLRFAEG